jgi:HSP20 family protein
MNSIGNNHQKSLLDWGFDFEKTLRNLFSGDDMDLQFTSPKVDIIEEKDKYVLFADLPGFSEDDVELKMENRKLKVFCRRRSEQIAETSRYHIRERFNAGFSRSFSLPEDVEPGSFLVSLANGVLRVELKRRIPS